MKINLLILVCALMALASCQSNSFKINGKIDNMPAQKFYLEENSATEKIILDSANTNPDGTFSMSGENAEPSLYRLRFERGKYVLLTLQTNDNAKITGDWNNLEQYDVKGSQGSVSIKNLLAALRAHITDVNTLDMVTKSFGKASNRDSLSKEVSKSLQIMNFEFAKYVKNFADTTKLLPNAVFAANLINPKVDAEFTQNFYDKLVQRYPKSALATHFVNIYNTKLKPTLSGNAQPATAPASPNVAVNTNAKSAPDFTATTPEGNNITLSSFRGKYVLLDFWASWCAPCRQENPNVVAAYNKFKDKNFTILSISLDDNQEKWMNAIAQDKLEWAHASDLKKWGSVPARLYNVQSIPTNFLIDPNGNIVAQNLRGANLISTLEKELK